MRSYVVRDKRWGSDAAVRVKVVASLSAERALWRIQTVGFKSAPQLQVMVSNIKRPKLHRNGDIGVDAADAFEADGKAPLQVLGQPLTDVCYLCADGQTLRMFLCRALADGKEFLFRCAAALPKVLGGVPDRPLLKREDLLDPGNKNGGIILVGSHVDRTSRQLAVLRDSSCPVAFLEFNQHRVLETGGLEDEAGRVLRKAEALLSSGKSVAVYTRRERLDLDSADSDRQLQISVRISDALTGIIGNLSVRPSFIVAKGGITSSDIGTKALHVRKALVKGQIRPGIPVWQTGEESKFPGLPFVIFPGNVGDDLDLLRIAENLTEVPAV